MGTYEFVTLGIAIFAIVASAFLTWLSIRSSNKSTRQMSILMRENSRMTSSEHLSLYRIEAFYNAVAIENLKFEIQNVKQKIGKAPLEDKDDLDAQLKKLQMNLQLMKIREAKLLQNDFTLQKELSNLHQELKM